MVFLAAEIDLYSHSLFDLLYFFFSVKKFISWLLVAE